VQHIPAAIKEAKKSKLQQIAFPIWWDNLRDRGKDVYRRIIHQPSSVSRRQWVSLLGDDPEPWLQVLSSTGVVVLDDDSVLARGTLFRQWVEENHPVQAKVSDPSHDALDKWLDGLNVDAFERLVVRTLAAWARATVEFPAAALKAQENPRGDNQDLQPEMFFQMHAIVALLTHEKVITAEPEALSMKSQDRSDIKIRYLADPIRRACVEFKIFGRNDKKVVKQVIEYAAPGDTFAAVVSVDRLKRPLRPAFEARCFEEAPYTKKHDAPSGAPQPVFLTEHSRNHEGYAPVRVWHFLLQLRDS